MDTLTESISRYRRSMETKTISASSTILWGVLTTILLLVVFFLVIIIFPTSFPTWANICICIFFPAIVFISGFTTIQATQTGLLSVFGTRQRTVITEGLVWLPPFTSVAIFDNKEQSTDIGEVELMSTNQISMKIKISYNWRIADNYQVSNLDSNVIYNGLTQLVKNEVRSEILNLKLNDINLINSDKGFTRGVIKACNETAESKWGIQITELFVATIRPATESMGTYYESKAKIEEIAEDSARIAKILGISPQQALDKYARERFKVNSVEHIYSVTEISKITALIEKLLKK